SIRGHWVLVGGAGGGGHEQDFVRGQPYRNAGRTSSIYPCSASHSRGARKAIVPRAAPASKYSPTRSTACLGVPNNIPPSNCSASGPHWVRNRCRSASAAPASVLR